MTNYSTEEFEVLFSDKEGYSVRSLHTGKTYDLLELRGFCGKATSDIVAIFETDPDFGYTRLVNYTFGATFLLDEKFAPVFEIIRDYESGKVKPMQDYSLKDF